MEKRNPDDVKQYKVVREVSAIGQSYVIIECPFCGCNFRGYIWSLAGSGKCCPRCKAKHGWMGHYAIRYTEGTK